LAVLFLVLGTEPATVIDGSFTVFGEDFEEWVFEVAGIS
jgi:hypothetical protein